MSGKAVRDAWARPSYLRADFVNRAALVDGAGQLDLSRLAGAEPVVSLPLAPDRVLKDHLADLAFELARAGPDLDGFSLPVGLLFDRERHPPLPVLVARESGADWGKARPLQVTAVPLETLDISCFTAPLVRRGLDPGELVFSALETIPAPDVAPTERRGLFAPVKGREHQPWLEVEVSRFARGPLPTAWHELSTAHVGPAELPVYLPIDLLRELIADEARFARERGDDWVERCWFLTGAVVRGEDRDLAAVVRRILPAAAFESTACRLELTPESWAEVRRELDAEEETLLGYLHTHSIGALSRAASEAKPERPAPNGPGLGGEAGTGEAPVATSLFVSWDDIKTSKESFRAPWMVTVVVDSDVCRADNPPLDQVVAAWGWSAGHMVRRSLRMCG